MNDGELVSKVNSSMYHQCQVRGYAKAVDVLMDVGYLTKEKYEDWRFGRVPFLEAVCMAGLSKLTLVRRTMCQYAQKNGLKPSATYYKQWGRRKKRSRTTIPLRFSKSGNPEIEKQYSSHFVDNVRIQAIKESRNEAEHPKDDNLQDQEE